MAWASILALAVLTALGASAQTEPALTLTSPDFKNGQSIPDRYAYHDHNQSPALQITGVPVGAKSLVLIVDDPDAPGGIWNHWLVWNIPPSTREIPAGKIPGAVAIGSVVGKNDFGNTRYDGPAPPSGSHRYFFKLYALDNELSLKPGAKRPDLDVAMNSAHVLANAELMGTYASR